MDEQDVREMHDERWDSNIDLELELDLELGSSSPVWHTFQDR